MDDGAGDNKDEEPHELRAFVVYDDAESDEDQVAAIKRAVTVIASAFKTKFYDESTATWKGIELVNCDAVSDEIFSFADSKIFKHWRLDHRSLEDDEQKLPVQGA
ncbi:hypothetical protein CSC62_12095 [Pseudoxanthomonas jiangsuensis]|nr:hypothetical protein CSC62_12095 [Pseudoxanthomonas jiangsuensis]